MNKITPLFLITFLILLVMWIITSIISHVIKAKGEDTKKCDDIISDYELTYFFAILIISIIEAVSFVP